MKCEGCGADLLAEAVRCDYCGAAVSRTNDATRVTRFAAIKQSPQFAAERVRQLLAVLPNLSGFEIGASLLFCLVFIGVTLFIGSMILRMEEGSPIRFVALVPFGMAAVVGMQAVGIVRRAAQLRTAAPVALPALVSAKRARTRDGSPSGGASADYFVTFEFEDGRRQEFTVDAALYAELAEGDAGIAFCRAEWAIRFERVL